MVQHLKNIADTLGLPFGQRTRTYNSRLAQELGLWAQSIDKGHAFHLAAFKAYFANGKNIAEKDVLLEIAQTSGLDVHAAASIIDKRSFSSKVDEDWQLSRQLGITAVPTFVCDGAKLTGAQQYDNLIRFVDQSGKLQRKI